MNHPQGSAMFLDLDKPVQRDPRERIEAAMEWEAISEMYRERDAARAGAGFLLDRHEERSHTMNPLTGRHRDIPAFNPPRRVAKAEYEHLPVELTAMIVEAVGDFGQRTRTRMISRSHALLTESLEDLVASVIKGVLKNSPDFSSIDPHEFINNPNYEPRFRMHGLLIRIFTLIFRRLGVPLIITVMGTDVTLSIGYRQNGGAYIELLWYVDTGLGSLGMWTRYLNPLRTEPEELWTHYPLIRSLMVLVPTLVEWMPRVDMKYVEEHYRKHVKGSE